MKRPSSSSLPAPRWQITSALTLTSMFVTSLTPLMSEPTHPAWWSDGNPPIIDIAATANNHGAANIGQAKWMVSEALRSLDTLAPSLAAEIRTDLEGTAPDYLDQIIDLTVPDPKDATWLQQQQGLLSLGQLKAIALPFYNHLNETDSTWVKAQIELNHDGNAVQNQHYWQVSGNNHHTEGGYFPWDPATSVEENKKAATIGQLKAVFALRFDTLNISSVDLDGDGLPDAWEQTIIDADPNDQITSISDVLPTDDFDNDGATNEAEFLAGTDPSDPSDTPGNSGEIPDTSDLVKLRVFTPIY